jgi:hypothetical protein
MIYLFLLFIILLIIIVIVIIYYNNINEKFYSDLDPITTNNPIINNVMNSLTDVYVQFNTSGTITFKMPTTCDILIIGGGGGGASRHGGGGGAGALIYLTNQVLSDTYNITIGTGGSGAAGFIIDGNNGNDTIVSKNGTNIYIAKGGGGGGAYNSLNTRGLTGGSSGGSSGGRQLISANPDNNNIPNGVFGNNGGMGSIGSGVYWAGGGGGGAGGAGNNANQSGSGTPFSGAGGSGKQIDITGTSVYYAGGGGGGLYNIYTPANGGIGGGGAGGNNELTVNANQNGIANTGGGGGGGGYSGGSSGTGGNGGSGVVIIRYRSISYQSRTSQRDADNEMNKKATSELIKYPTTFPTIINDVVGSSINNYSQTFLINGLLYTIKFSSYDENYRKNTPLNLFDSNNNNIKNIGGSFSNNKTNRYDNNTGEYLDTSIGNFTNNGVSERGEWVSIQLPMQITLKYYGFVCIDGLENLAPGKWKVYAKQNNSYILIDDYTTSRLTNVNYKNNSLFKKYINPEKQINSNTYVFIFKALASSDINNYLNYKLNFNEILLLGE